jgi:hypothetical protein
MTARPDPALPEQTLVLSRRSIVLHVGAIAAIAIFVAVRTTAARDLITVAMALGFIALWLNAQMRRIVVEPDGLRLVPLSPLRKARFVRWDDVRVFEPKGGRYPSVTCRLQHGRGQVIFPFCAEKPWGSAVGARALSALLNDRLIAARHMETSPATAPGAAQPLAAMPALPLLARLMLPLARRAARRPSAPPTGEQIDKLAADPGVKRTLLEMGLDPDAVSAQLRAASSEAPRSDADDPWKTGKL